MAQIDPNTIQWDAPPQPVGKPVTGAKDQPLQGGVILPGKPEKPEKPTETFRMATQEEKVAAGLDPNRSYQINNVTGEFKDVGGQPTAKPAVEVDPERIPQINTGLSAVKDLRKLSQQFLSVGKQAGNISETPIIGSLLGQNRADLEGSIQILKGIIIQDQLKRLAKINPAGVASLANTPGEQERFVSAIANLDPNQGPEQFEIGLKRAEDYLNRQLQEAGGQAPTPTGGEAEAGPKVTVTPEESIAEFGELAYDKNGNLVGRAYSQSGAGVYYNSKGEEVGIIRGVAEEKVQEPAPSFFGGIARDIGEAVTGSERATATTEGLPDWVEMPEMQQLFSLPTFKAALGTAFGGGPQEIAQIVQSNFPGTQVFQDEKGNYILQSPSTGQRYAIKPGFQVSDIPRAIGTVLAGGGIQGGVRGAMAVGAREAGLQTGIEALQAGTGGTFNPEDIAMAGVGGGVLQKAGEVLPAAAGRVVGTMRRGTAPAPVIPQGVPELPGGLTRPAGGMPSGGPASPAMAFEKQQNQTSNTDDLLAQMLAFSNAPSSTNVTIPAPIGQIKTIELPLNQKMFLGENGAKITVMEDAQFAPRKNSITEFVVPEEYRGSGIGGQLLDNVLSRYNPLDISAAVSSDPSVALFYKRGFRPISNPNASLDEAMAIRRDQSSVTMVIPEAPRTFEAGETVTSRAAGAMSASEETIRAQRAAELPVPIELARFQRTRNFAEQQRARELAKNNEVGGPIRDRMSQQQEALRQNFERFIEGTGSQVWENPYEQGGVIADALSTLAKRERTKINALYKRAEQAGEMREPVSYRSLSDFIAGQTPTTREKLAPVLRTVQEQLDAADPNKTGMITLNQMEDIRKLINKVASPGTPDASFGRDMRGIIDDATKDAGGDVYRQARSARAKYARDFDDIDLVQKIYSTKPGSTERYVALEKVVDRITGTSAPLDSVNRLLSLLDRAGPRGARAKKELQGAVMEKIRDQAYRGITRDESGGVVIQPAALNSIIVQLDKSGKLDAIFDKKTAELLRTVNDVTKDIVTAPPGSVNASGTSSAIMNAIDTVATFGTTGIPVPAAKILNEFRKALANRSLRKEVKRLLD